VLELHDVQRFFEAQQAKRRALAQSTAEQRIERLLRLRGEVERRAADIGVAINEDLGRPVENRDEVNTVLGNIDKVQAELADWMAPLGVPRTPGLPDAKGVYVRFESRGVVLLFGTWDFPIGMFFSPLVQAVAAGNTVLGKTSSMAPTTGKVIEEIVSAAFPPEEVIAYTDRTVSTPEGESLLRDVLLDLPVDHIFLTGSPKVGSTIVKAASQHLATFTVELGGKSPLILDDTSNLDKVVDALIGPKIYNHGQTCLSCDYLWVPPHRREELIEKFTAAVQAAYYEHGVYQWQRDGRFVDRRNFDRVKGYLDEAIAKGAKVAFGGASNADSLTIEPTVFTDIPVDTDVIQEELFGPILPVLTYTDEQEIYAHSASLGKPLGFYIFSSDDEFVERVLANTTSGGVTVNGGMLHWVEENLPFGDVNSSGYGRYHGVWGFRELSNARSVFHAVA
jgi:aldehyde dehydrogenase (NAD+)